MQPHDENHENDSSSDEYPFSTKTQTALVWTFGRECNESSLAICKLVRIQIHIGKSTVPEIVWKLIAEFLPKSNTVIVHRDFLTYVLFDLLALHRVRTRVQGVIPNGYFSG